MQMTVEDRPEGFTYAKLVGHMDVPGTNAISVKLQGQIAPRRQHTVLDIADVDYISSLGIGQLVAVATSLRRSKKKIAIVGAQPMVAGMLRATRVDSVMPLFDTVEQAVATFEPATA